MSNDSRDVPIYFMSEKLQPLTKEEQQYLLQLVRKSLETYLTTKKMLVVDEQTVPENLRCIGTCFVTYHEFNQLRGCIGNLLASRPLYIEVLCKAVEAAVQDPRFRPVTMSEFSNLEVEISVLSNPEPISSYEEIILGKHGIILEKYGKRAVFLPQVPEECGWNLEQTLTNLARKATLHQDAWRKDAHYHVFTAQVFSEAQFK